MDNLHPDHLRDLEKSGLSVETIRAAGIHSVPLADLKKILGGKFPGVQSAYSIPFLGNGFVRLKFFPPQKTENETVRYWQEPGTSPKIYVPPLRAVDKLQDVNATLFIVEGEKKSLAACQNGLCCIGVTGLWSWKSRAENDLISDFDNILLKDRRIEIIPDSDWLKPDKHGKPRNLWQAVKGLAGKLRERRAIVEIVLLPDLPDNGKTGLDDFLLVNSVAEFLALPRMRPEDISPVVLPTLSEIAGMDVRVEYLLEKIIPKNSLIVIHGKGGIRKTWLMLQIGSAISGGGNFAGLKTVKTPVYYVDFENGLSTLCERARILGPSEMRVWHLSNTISPPRFDTDDWTLYKHLAPGVLIVDSHRSSNLLDENSSQDQAFVMARHKELREAGFTVCLIHHTAKADDRKYKGSTAIQDLCDVVLGLERVRAVGSDESVDDDEEDDLPFRFGVRGKTRFEPFSMYLRFDPDRGFYPAEDPNFDTLAEMQHLLLNYQETQKREPNQTEFYSVVKAEMDMGRKGFRRLLVKGDGRFWVQNKGKNCGSKAVVPLLKGGQVKTMFTNLGNH